jgi:hypothetical protein
MSVGIAPSFTTKAPIRNDVAPNDMQLKVARRVAENIAIDILLST